MIAGSGGAAWIMLKKMPRKTVKLANPMSAASKYHGGSLAPSAPNIHLGEEHSNMSRKLHDLSEVLPVAALTER
eukprot:828523-Karenia_brevis.AAC.1